MDSASYLNLSQGLAGETRDIPEEPVLDDVVNDGKRYIKSGLEGIGSQLAGHSLIKKLTGKAGSKAKKALDLSEEEMKDLQSKAESGDYEGAIGKIFKGVIKKGSSKLEQAVNSAVNKGDLPTSKGDLGKAARRAARAAKRALKKKAQPDEAGPAEEEPQGEEDIREAMNRLLQRNQPISKQEPQELSPLKSNDSPFSQDDPIQDRPRAPYGKQPAPQQEDKAPPEEQTEPGEDPDALQPAEKELAKQGEKEVEQQVEKKTVEETLKDTAEASTAEDDKRPPKGMETSTCSTPFSKFFSSVRC